jgi:toxin ParE1/3/4
MLPEAEEDIHEAACWYEDREIGLGLAFTALVRDALERIEANPTEFAVLETNRTGRDIRRFLLKRFPFVVIFEVGKAEAVVLAVAHGRRSPRFWKNRG